jgi:hypothetical protein
MERSSVNMKTTAGLLIAFSCLSLSWDSAYTDSTAHDFEGWLIVSSHIPLESTKKYQLYAEIQPRLGDDWQRAATVQLRGALNYNVSKALAIYLGEAWTPAFYDSNYHHQYRDEHRVWEGVTLRHPLMGLEWEHRLRQEQRFIENTDEVAHRSRYRLKSSYSLSEDEAVGLTGWNEIMVNFNSVQDGPWSGYDRDRFFIGPYWKRDNVRYEFGYLGEHLKRFGNDERWANVIALSISAQF